MSKNEKQIVLFDGVCNLCNGVVNFVIDRDPKSKFVFATLQSAGAQELLSTKEVPLDLETIVLIKEGQVYLKSSAALQIAKELSGLWPVFYAFIILPPFVRDFFYKLIANNRYRLFGKQDQCRIPTPDLTERFIFQ